MKHYTVLHYAIIVVDILAFLLIIAGAILPSQGVTSGATTLVIAGASWALLSLFLLHPWESLLEDIRSIRNKLETKSPDGQHK